MYSFTRFTVANKQGVGSVEFILWHIIKGTNYLSIFCNFYLHHTFQLK